MKADTLVIYVCPLCAGTVEAVAGAKLWHPCPRAKGRQVALEATEPEEAA